MEFIIIGLVSAFNMLVIKFKIDRKRYEDAAFDTILLIVVSMMFNGSYAGMVVAMVASLVISIVFFISPPTFFSSGKLKGLIKEQWEELDADLTGKPKKPKPKVPKEDFHL